MPARICIILKNFEAHQQNVEAHQASVISFHDIRSGNKCSDINSSTIISWYMFREVVESKIEDPRGRLTRLIKCTVKMPEILSNTASNFHPMKGLLRQSTS